MRKIAALLFILPLCVVQMAFAQNKTITGKITSTSESEALPGATVIVKGTTIGTVTDIDGNYVISVPSSSETLQFSFIGYKSQTVSINGRSSIDIALEDDALGLDEVVVTAIGISSEKKALNYSAQEIGSEQIVAGKNSNLINNLNGKVAGLNVTSSAGTPGSSAYMTIRGSRSITGDNQPLMVIDGVPFDNSQNYSGNFNNGRNNLLQGVGYSNRAIDINPEDIESITVLKGAAASVLYGSRASNGVILITTKKGSGSAGKDKMNVTFNSSVTFDQVTQLPELQNTYSQGSGGAYSGPENGGSGSWGASIDTLSWNGDDSYIFDQNGAIVSSNDPSAVTAVTPYENVSSFFQTGTTYENSLALSGGDYNSNYYFSIGNLSQEGIVPLSDFGRTSIRLAGETALSSKWKSSASISYVKSGGTRVQQGSNTSGLMLGLLRTTPTFDNSNGATDPTDPSAYIFADGAQRNYRGGGGYDNPYWTINQNPFIDDVNRMFGNTTLTYTPFSWLNVTYRLGADFYSDRRKQIFAINSRTLPAGQIQEDQQFFRQINSDLLVTLSKAFTEKSNGSLTLGNNANIIYTQQFYSQGDGLVIPEFYNMSNATSVITQEFNSEVRTLGYFAAGKFDYNEVLYLELTGRFDKSSTFNNGEKGYFYPAASVGLVVTELLGLENNNIFPYGKLRVSYAQLGKQPGAYLTATTYSPGFYSDGYTNGVSFPYLGQGGFQNGDNLGNPDLGPETTTSFEIGADLRFAKNRIGVDFTYYSAISTDQIINVPIAATSGYLTQTLNAAEVENKGIELALTLTPVKTKDFNWDITLNFSRNRSLVKSLADGVDFISLGGFEGSLIAVVAGQPFGVIYGTQWLHDADGNIVIADETAVADPNNAAYLYDLGYPMIGTEEGVIGDPNPDYVASLINSFSYKGISLYFQFDQRKGGDIWNGTRGALDFFGTSIETAGRDEEIVFEGVSGHLDENLEPVSTGTNSASVLYNQDWVQGGFGSGFTGPTEAYIEDGSFIRLREVAISYAFAPKLIEKTPIAGLEIGLSARNLLLITDYTGVDPETSLVGANSAQGLDYFNMPNTRSLGINLRLTL